MFKEIVYIKVGLYYIIGYFNVNESMERSHPEYTKGYSNLMTFYSFYSGSLGLGPYLGRIIFFTLTNTNNV